MSTTHPCFPTSVRHSSQIYMMQQLATAVRDGGFDNRVAQLPKDPSASPGRLGPSPEPGHGDSDGALGAADLSQHAAGRAM